MFSRVIVSSLLLAALANGLAFKRDDGYSSSTPPAISLPTVTPRPILLPDPSISLSLPPLNADPTSTLTNILLPSSLPSVVTTTVYVYPTQCSPTPTLPPTSSSSGVPDNTATLPYDDHHTPRDPAQPTPIRLPEEPALELPKVRRDDSVISQLRDLEQEVINTWVDKGKGDVMLSVVGQIEAIIAKAVVPGADGVALLKEAQSLVYDS
ncbi:hypothetical protein BDM02DRAFT_3184165 [Thelephora ganbajun]|uniref:Uncharacterized protein n=1 Tax=Thelephora ganbajun TaxID=370292 RepID=A0ACB6ZQR5_THEGA|nr:hypothetical protein BDM02DRAFT_3184165 [Thelephora ganbajun]